MALMNRRKFIALGVTLPSALSLMMSRDKSVIQTVRGPIRPEELGNTLIHEHILVDFIGAAQYDPNLWDDARVIEKVLPYLEEAKQAGCKSMVECTPAFLGRDVQLLRALSVRTGLHIVTNTGYYGGSDHKFLPPQVFTETPDMLAARWTKEFTDGIENTDVRPGFIKISVNDSALSPESAKLVRAAAICHKQTGLTIAAHTGPAVPAFESLAILASEKVSPEAYIWVHAQNESDYDLYVKAARQKAWVSLDGLAADNVDGYVERLRLLKREKCLGHVLVSHDAGWYDPRQPDGGNFRGYTPLFKLLIPALEESGFTDAEIETIIRINPRNAFTIRVRK